MKVKYKGTEIELLDLCIKHKEIYPNGQWVRVAPESFSSLLTDDNCDYTESEAIAIDEDIYHYIPDDVFKKADLKDIAKNHLDETFELLEDVDNKLNYKDLTERQKDTFARKVVDEMDMDNLVCTAIDRVMNNWEKDNDLFDEDNEIYCFGDEE
jgi:hypothetical protein